MNSDHSSHESDAIVPPPKRVFVEVSKSVNNPKSVWSHFTKETNSHFAKCNHCDEIRKCTGGSTTGLWSHLNRKHDISAPKTTQSQGTISA